MLSFKTELKKAAAVLHSGHGTHGRLSVSLLNLKLLEESFCKVADTQQDASLSLVEWTRYNEDERTRELYTRLADLDILHARLFKRHSQQIETARLCYKAIAKGEKHLVELKKEQELLEAKANKARKQLESVKKKKDKEKIETLEMDLATAYSQESKAAGDLTSATENHKKFKLSKIQEALRVTQKANADFHKEGLEIANVKEKIMLLFFGSNSEEYTPKAGVLAASLITSLAEDLELPRPISIADKQAGASFQTHHPLRMSDHSTPPSSHRSSAPVYFETPEKEVNLTRPKSATTNNRAAMPLPALPLYPSLPSGDSPEGPEYGELYAEQYYSYTDLGDCHPSGILMKNEPPKPPPRPPSSLKEETNLRKRNSAPVSRGQVDLGTTDVQGNPLPEPAPDSPDREYVSLIAEGIYDNDGNLQVSTNRRQTAPEETDEEDYMSLQGIRRPQPSATRKDCEEHLYDNRISEDIKNERM